MISTARRAGRLAHHLARCNSTASNLIAAPELAAGSHITCDLFPYAKGNGHGCVLTLGKAPVNSLNEAFFDDIHATCESLVADERVSSVVLASAFPKVFSAGLDFTPGVLVDPEKDRFCAMWSAFQRALMALHLLPMPLVAAVNGVAMAGGTVLSLTADHRLVTPSVLMGLNEASIGMVPPRWLDLMLEDVVGHKRAEHMLVRGQMYKGGDAVVQAGLGDECAEADDLDELHARAMGKAEELASQFTPHGAILKQRFRAAAAAEATDAAVLETWEYVRAEPFQAFVRSFLAKTKK